MPRIRRKLTLNYLLDLHGPKIGAVLCALSTVVVASACLWLLVTVTPDAVQEAQDLARELVAETRGVTR